jgi:hypothetical protein
MARLKYDLLKGGYSIKNQLKTMMGAMIMETKKWKKPKLIILYRGRPEEAVLLACKSVSGKMTNPKFPASGWSAAACRRGPNVCSGLSDT